MKRKFYILLSCALLSVTSGVILQAMTGSAVTSDETNESFYYAILGRMQDHDSEGALTELQRALKQGFDVNYQSKRPSYMGALHVRTLLHNATLFEMIDLVKALLSAGANPNIAGHMNFGPLHQAAASRSSAYVYDDAIIEKKATTIKQLIQELVKAGADVSAKGGYFNNTPLIEAADRNNIPAIEALLDVPGIDFMAKNKDGKTALNVARDELLLGHKGAQTIVKLLSRPRYTTLQSLSIDQIVENIDQYRNRLHLLPLDIQEQLLPLVPDDVKKEIQVHLDAARQTTT